MTFEFASAGRIVFGPGAFAGLGEPAAALGRRALLVHGRSTVRAQRAAQLLVAAAVDAVCLGIAGEPTLDDIRRGASRARELGADLVVAIGGGSAIDAGKAIAALAASDADLLDHLEVIGRGEPLRQPPLPLIAVPTTAGTGAEVTRNAVLFSPEHRVKVSLRSPWLLPRVALVDPALLLGAPPAVIAASGLDAFTQLVEPFVSSRANPLTDALCREGLRRSARSLRRAFAGELDGPVAEDLAVASLCGGLALANAGLGAVHGFAAPVGGMFAVPHGAACAALLPAVVRANVRALESRQPRHPALARYREVAALVTGEAKASPDQGIAWIEALVRDLRIPGLGHYGATEADLAGLVARARESSSMKGNPIELSEAELLEVAAASFRGVSLSAESSR